MIATAIVVLCGCSDTPSDIEQLDQQLLSQLETGQLTGQKEENAITIDLGSGFVSAIRAAVEQNDGYRAALSLEQEAAAAVGVSSSALRPQFAVNATMGAIYEGDPISETTSGLAGGVTLSQLIYDGGKVQGAITQAEAKAVAIRAERHEKANQIGFDAARAWIDLWQNEQRLSWLSSKTSKMDELVSQIDRMATNGMLDRASLDSAKRQILDIKLQRTTLKAQMADSQTRFRRFFDKDVTRVSEPVQVFNAAMARRHADAWKTAPALRRVAAELVAARGSAAEAEGAFKPNISLQAGALSPLDTDDTTDLNAGIRFEYAFGDGGRRKAALKAANFRVDALEQKLADDWRTAEASMDAALQKLASLESSMPLVSQKIDLTKSEAQTARSQIATGQSNLRQLVEAEIENYRARDQHIQMVAEKHLLLLEIAATTGLLARLLGLEDV